MTDRLKTLSELVAFSKPLEILSHELSQFEWDYTGIPVMVTPNHLLKVLEQFAQGKLNAQEVEDWANLVEGREDLAFSEEILNEIVYELANPELEGELDRVRAMKVIQELQDVIHYQAVVL